jgi:SPX domain protein involved in polyphosphate accumulation
MGCACLSSLFIHGNANLFRYEIYDTLTLWPPEVRSDLRSGLRAKHRGDLDASEQYLQRFVYYIVVILPDPR